MILRINTFKKYSIIILTVFSSLIFSFLLLETIIRISIDEVYWKFIDSSDDWVIDDKIGWRQKSNLDITHLNGGKTIRFQTNQDGLQVVGKSSADIRILLIGDSTIVSRNVPSEDRIQNHLYEYLGKHLNKDTYIVNAGVQGYSTDQSLLLLKDLISKYNPTFVFHVMCNNDLMQNQSFNAHKMTKPRFELLNGNLKLLQQTKKNTNIPRLGSGFRILIQYSALYRLLRPIIVDFRLKLGTINTVNNLSYIENNFDYLNKVNWNLFLGLINEMKIVSEKNNAEFILMKHPSLEEVWPPYRNEIGISELEALKLENKIISITKNNNIFYLPVIEYFNSKQHLGPFHLLPRDPHANSKGYELQANIIGKYILDKIKIN